MISCAHAKKIEDEKSILIRMMVITVLFSCNQATISTSDTDSIKTWGQAKNGQHQKPLTSYHTKYEYTESPGALLQTGLSKKGQDLFYTISDYIPTPPKFEVTEINKG